MLDERFERAYREDDDFLARLRQAGISTRQVASVRVKHIGGLTTVKVPEHRRWLEVKRAQVRGEVGLAPAADPALPKSNGTPDVALLSELPELAGR